MLAIAGSLEGRYAQALPGFGVERTAGEVVACCRISEYEVSLQEPITRPDAVIIGEHALLDQAPVLDGLRDDGYLLVNSGQRIDPLPLLLRPGRSVTVPATELARKLTGGSIPNTALLGGLVALSGVVLIDSVLTAIRQWFRGSAGKAHAAAALATFGVVRTEVEELARMEMAP
jgi:pyruvate ferredoxin oxidoreductase gamma subunit